MRFAVKTPIIIDMTDAMIDKHGANHVLCDAEGTVVALCPLADDVLPNGQFSYAPDIQRAVNCHSELLAFVKRFAKLDPVFANDITLARKLVARAEA